MSVIFFKEVPEKEIERTREISLCDTKFLLDEACLFMRGREVK